VIDRDRALLSRMRTGLDLRSSHVNVVLLFAQQSSAKLPGFLVETIGFWNGFPYEGD